MDNFSVYPPASLVDVCRDLGIPLRGRNGSRLRGQASWRESRDWNISIDLDLNVFYDHARCVGGGPASLVMGVLDCSAHDAGRWLREHFGGGQPEQRSPCVAHRLPDRDELAEAQAIRGGLVWHVEWQLELMKLLLCGPCHARAAVRVRRLTVQLERVRAWTPQRTVTTLRRFGRRRPDYINYLYGDFEEFQTSLALALAGVAG